MENDILEALTDLGYEGPLLDENNLLKALEEGPKSLDFTKLVHILSEELKSLCNLDESVNMMNDPSESSTFLLELSSFLKELGCPYSKLVLGHLSSRIQNKDDAMLLLDYLISELMAARMVNIDKPKDISSSMEIVMQESPTAKDLKDILITLKFNKPPPNITLEILFSKLETKLRDTIQKEGEQLVGKPIYNKAITDKQWRELETSYIEMLEEYRLRRETLITRLDCTVLSFEWSDRLKKRKDELQTIYRPLRNQLKVKPDVKLSDFLAARTSLYHIEKTSSASVRKNTQSDVAKVIIGRVPDRGGRPNEQQPPPPEMPPWQQRQAVSGGGPPGRGGRGGGGSRGGPGFGGGGPRGSRGGGRVQGGYNNHSAGGDQAAHLNSGSGPQSHPQRNYQTYEVPAGGYNTHTYTNQQSGYNNQQNYGGGGGGRGHYNNNHDFNNQGYNNSGPYSQGGPGGGGYNQGYKSNLGPGGYNRGGYQNEHDDRDRRGRSSYNRGGRR